jgi:large conductance mechanosensitive channel
MLKMEKKKTKKKISKLREEFKNFAFKEATLGAAVGIMLGGAFRDVINSLVNDILTPPIGYFTSGIDFTSLYWVLGKNDFDSLELAREAGAVVIHYGNFLSEFISFLITAFILFLITYQGARIINRMNKKEEKEKKKEKKRLCQFCKTEIEPKATRCPACTSQL